MNGQPSAKDNPAAEYVEESSFVVSCIDIDGSFVKLSFDGNGHGTHVAVQWSHR